MTNKTIGIGMVAVLIIAIVGVFTPAGQNVVERVVEKTGAIAGSDTFNVFRMHGGSENGGFVRATSTANATATLLATDLYNPNTDQLVSRVEITPTGANLTLTLPASSTLGHILTNDGDTFSFLIENEATAATTTTIAAGAGMDLQEPDGQNVVIGQNNFAWMTIQRNGQDFVVRVDETIPAD